MKILKIILIFFFCSFSLYSQKDSLKNFPDSAQVMGDLYFLASDSLEGRKTGELGNKIARNYIVQRLQKVGIAAYVEGYVQEFDFIQKSDTLKGQNILGFIEGFSEEGLIVLSAHYDHVGMKNSDEIYNGADDNASGVGALLALAEYFQAHQPNHDILLAFFDAEEMGLRGAKYFMQSVVVDSSSIKLNINMDMVSRGDNNKLYAVGTYIHPQLKPYLQKVGEASDIDLTFGRDVPDKKPYWVNASDHSPFHEAGIPFIYFGVDDHPDYHKISDTPDKVDPNFYLEAIRLIQKSVIELDAALPEIVENKKIIPKK